jgi:DNA-binding PadR family transcriptional regulator
MEARALSTPDLTRGGRHLEAIDLNANLTAHEKLILHIIASQLKMSGDFLEERWVYISTLVTRSSLSERQVYYVLRSLEDKGYIVRRAQYAEQKPIRKASYFRLTAKLFDEFDVHLQDRQVRKLESVSSPSANRAGGSLQDVQPPPAQFAERTHASKLNQYNYITDPPGGASNEEVDLVFTLVKACCGKNTSTWLKGNLQRVVQQVVGANQRPLLEAYREELTRRQACGHASILSLVGSLQERAGWKDYLADPYRAYQDAEQRRIYGDW